MSGALMEWVVDMLPKLAHAPARVLLVLARHANDDGTSCFPSLMTIAVKAEMPKSTVLRALAELRERKYVRLLQGGVGGRAKKNQYRLTLGQPTALADPDNPDLFPETVAPRTPLRTGANGRARLPQMGEKGSMASIKGSATLPDSIKTQPSKGESSTARAAEVPVPEAGNVIPLRRPEWRPREGTAPITEAELAAVDAWNDLQRRVPNLLAAARDRIDDKRLQKLRDGLAQVGGLVGWMAVLAGIERSRFWRGEVGDKVRRYGIEHALEPGKLTKLLEGFYDEWKVLPTQPRQPRHTPESVAEGVLRAAGAWTDTDTESYQQPRPAGLIR